MFSNAAAESLERTSGASLTTFVRRKEFKHLSGRSDVSKAKLFFLFNYLKYLKATVTNPKSCYCLVKYSQHFAIKKPGHAYLLVKSYKISTHIQNTLLFLIPSLDSPGEDNSISFITSLLSGDLTA